ncbi:MAG: FAD-binding oxidoreductase [Oscillospiraceae bacterium]|nr:FAD-binding oxidoreductase [Oscillospiraceae bacterium]
MHKSVWSENTALPAFEKLSGEKKCDVLVIGGGICGLLCAYFLKNAGVNCVLVEGKTIASGTTKNTTAKITSQHGLIYSKLMKLSGEEKAGMYYNANERALEQYEKLCRKIECDFERCDAYTYSLRDRVRIEKEVNSAQRLGADADFLEECELPFQIKGAVRFKNQAQFNPLKFISGIAKGLDIYENTLVRDITPDCAVSENGKIRADKIIVSTHFPFINKHGSYFLKLY